MYAQVFMGARVSGGNCLCEWPLTRDKLELVDKSAGRLPTPVGDQWAPAVSVQLNRQLQMVSDSASRDNKVL